MTDVLIEEAFSSGVRAELLSFHCGDDVWSRQADDWIKGRGVEESIERGTQVWIYRLPAGDIVGFGSLGQARWSWPKRDRSDPVSVIPQLAIQYRFRGQPAGVPRNERYSSQLMISLITKAQQQAPTFLALEVHQDNHRAKALYEAFGFQYLPKSIVKNFDGAPQAYQRMFIRIR